MEPKDSYVGAILAGGAGRRIGGNKATQVLAGKTLARFAADVLVTCSHIALVGDDGAADLINTIGLSDPIGFPKGPLSGVCAALIWAAELNAEFLVTIPCDTPFLPLDCPARLVDAARTKSALVVSARSESGIEPLIAAWRVGQVLPILEAALRDGLHPAVHAFMSDLDGVHVELTKYETTNINTLDALALAEAWLRQDLN
jgi:molybdenum cofactor guanylyltransferase